MKCSSSKKIAVPFFVYSDTIRRRIVHGTGTGNIKQHGNNINSSQRAANFREIVRSFEICALFNNSISNR